MMTQLGFRKVFLFLCGALVGGVLFAAPPVIQKTERGVRVETDRYIATLDNGLMVSFINKFTKEEYLDNQADPAGFLPHLPSGLGTKGTKEQLDGARRIFMMPWGEQSSALYLPNQHYATVESKFTFEAKDPNGCVLTYKGLTDGKKTYNDVYSVTVSVDEETGDLLVTPFAKSSEPGVYGANFTVNAIDRGITIEAPIFDGVRLTHDLKPQLWINEWANFWDYAFLALNGRRTGAVGIWCQDAELKYYKHLYYLVNDEGISFSLGSLSIPPYDELKEAQGQTWRFQAFDKSWAQAAARFRNWRQANVKIAPRPQWTREVNMVSLGVNGRTRWMQLLSNYVGSNNLPHTVTFSPTIRKATFDTQHWDNTPHDGLKEDMKAWKASGAKLMAYLQPMIMWGSPPADPAFRRIYDMHLDADTRGAFQADTSKIRTYMDQHHLGHPEWQKWFLGCVSDYINVYGTDGVYHDQSYICPIDNRGLSVNKMTSTMGMADYFYKAAMLNTNAIHGTEHLTEVNSVGASLGIGSGLHWSSARSMRMQRVRNASPISNSLHYPNATIFGFPHFTDYMGADSGNFHMGMDLSERRGEIPGQNLQNPSYFPANVPFEKWVNEYKMNRSRTLTFLEYGLRPAFPEDWDRKVRSYFSGRKGEEFRYENTPWGSRFVQVLKKGSRLVYARIHGVTETNVEKGTGGEGLESMYLRDLTNAPLPVVEGNIAGWVMYNADGPSGLNPETYYILDPDVKRPAVSFAGSLYEGCVEDGYVNSAVAMLRLIARPQTVVLTGGGALVLSAPEAPKMVWVNGKVVKPGAAGEGKYSIGYGRYPTRMCVLLKDPPAGFGDLLSTAGYRAVSEVGLDNFDSAYLTSLMKTSTVKIAGKELKAISGPEVAGDRKQMTVAVAPPVGAVTGVLRVHILAGNPCSEFAVNGVPLTIMNDVKMPPVEVKMAAKEPAVISVSSRGAISLAFEWVEAPPPEEKPAAAKPVK